MSTRRSIEHYFGKPRALCDDQVVRLDHIRGLFYEFAQSLSDALYLQDGNEEIFDQLAKVKDLVDSNIKRGRHIITPQILAEFFRSIEEKDQLVAQVFLNVHDYAELRQNHNGVIDFTSKAEDLRRGLQGIMWNSEIWVSKHIPQGYCRLVGEQEPRFTSSNIDADSSRSNLTKLY